MSSRIEWTDETWNPITGCTKISPGCVNCYAERMAKRLAGRFGYPSDNPFQVTLHPDRMSQPSKWKKPRRVFVCSMSDLFHDAVPYAFIDRIFREIAMADFLLPGKQRHTWQILTKRAKRMNHYMTEGCFKTGQNTPFWPLPNVWLGITAENQEQMEKRLPLLMATPAHIRFISIEPMLGPIDLGLFGTVPKNLTNGCYLQSYNLIHWVIVGCESGPGRRTMALDWARNIVAQCREAQVPVFVKQLSIDGHVSTNPEEWPQDLRVREYPDV